MHDDTPTGLEIAIIGLAGRFPGAPDLATFWRQLRDGVEAVVHYSDAQLRARGVSEAMLADPSYVKAGLPLEGLRQFDAEFFGYTPRDAALLDPQHRLFLECAWQALEHAGCDPQRAPGPVGVYAGAGANVYLMRHLLPRQALEGEGGEGGDIAQLLGLVSGNLPDALCTRVAYKLDLRGPAVTVQTACSTSLMAVHTACQALLAQECDIALAGGVSLNLLNEDKGYRHQAGAIFSPDGHCRAFDARAAGTLQGSGVGVVVLKRLAEALRDGDTVHAVIKGSAANNDGAAKVGFTAPSVPGQAAVITAALAVAGVSADTVGCIEAHGTGTALGDPIEVAALTQAFRADTARRGFCALGSAKTHIGHLDAAAGVAGLIKAVLALQHRTLPPSLHFERPHPELQLEDSPFYVPTQAQPWPAGQAPRRAGVSAFGIGGTNVHLVLEESPQANKETWGGPALAPESRPTQAGRESAGWQVLPLSARDPVALGQAAQRLAAHLREPGPPAVPALADVAQTLQLGRRAFAHRAAVVAENSAMAIEALAAPLPCGPVPEQPPEVVFLFSGGGAQHANMGLALYRSEPVFRDAVDQACERLRGELGFDLRTLLFPPQGGEAAADEALARIEHAQPALFVIGHAMARLWMARGVQPALMLGHSLGEYVAACLAGVFSLDAALHLVAARGRLLASLPPGAMTLVPLDQASLAPFLQAGCELGAQNGEQLSVLSGPVAAIEAAEAALRARGLTPRRLHVGVASHSAMTEPVMAALQALVAAVPRQAPQRPFLSCVTGQPITAEQATSPAYWAQHLRQTVRFADALRQVFSVPGRVLLEVGPGEVLSSLARQHPLAASAAGIWPSQAHPQQQARSPQQMARALAGLWCAGVPVDWAASHPGRAPRRVPLPGYALQRREHWIAPPERGQAATAPRAEGPFHRPVWRPAPVRPGGAAPGAVPGAVHGAVSGGAALVLAGDSGLAEPLIARLRAAGATVLRADPAPAFVRHAPAHYGLRPGQREDCAALLAALARDGVSIDAVYHLWSVDRPGAGAPDEATALAQGFHALLALVQAWEAPHLPAPGRPARWLVAASAAEDLTGQEPLCPARAMLLPLCKVIGQEHPQLDTRFVDVALGASAKARERLAQQLVDESLAPRAHDTAVAYRAGSGRWLKDYEAFALPAAPAPGLRPQGVYLITGGLGGVGLALAQHLAQHQQARLVLLGRSAVPPRAQWARLAADASQPAGERQRLQALLALEAAGAQVLVLSADVADPAALKAAVAQARAHFGALHGVVHAAGQADNGLLGTRSAAAVAQVLAPKLAGTRALMEVFAGEPLDFMLLCASIASISGGLGKADYAAANAYQDAAALGAARRSAYPVIAVDWDAWRGLGMAAGLRIPAGIGWDGREGAQVFERIVDAAVEGLLGGQLVISTTELSVRLGRLDGAVQDLLARPDEAPPAQGGSAALRPTLATPYAAPSGELQERLCAQWAQRLGIDRVGVHDSLFELGGDSLMALQLLAQVRQAFGVELHPAALFKSPTVHDLALLIEERLIEEIEQIEQIA